MKLTHIFFLGLFGTILLLGCQPEEVAPLAVNSTSLQTEPNPSTPFFPVSQAIPPDEVIRTDYNGTTKWRITYDNPGAFDENRQWHFSTITGNFHTSEELNNNARASSQADFTIWYNHGSIMTPNYIGSLDHYSPNTKIKVSDLTVMELVLMTGAYPAQFQSEFEDNTGNMKGHHHLSPGQIVLFKTDRTPARYGSVRMVKEPSDYSEEGGELVLEIVVQK